MDVRADAADTFHDVDVLHVATVLKDALKATVDVANAQGALHDAFALDGEQKREWLFERRMLRADGDGHFGHGNPPPSP